MRIEIAKMSDLPVGHRQRIRELSLGPIAWGAWSWTFQDGSCWAAVGFDGDEVIGWSACTFEVDMLPVVGAFVAPSWRGRGTGSVLVTTLLRYLGGRRMIAPGAEIFNSTWRFPAYDGLIESCGFKSRRWE